MSSHINSAIQTSPADTDTVLLDMQKLSGSLGEFLQELFRHPSSGNKDKGSVWSQKHSQMVAKFFQGWSKVKAEEIDVHIADCICCMYDAVCCLQYTVCSFPADN